MSDEILMVAHHHAPEHVLKRIDQAFDIFARAVEEHLLFRAPQKASISNSASCVASHYHDKVGAALAVMADILFECEWHEDAAQAAYLAHVERFEFDVARPSISSVFHMLCLMKMRHLEQWKSIRSRIHEARHE